MFIIQFRFNRFNIRQHPGMWVLISFLKFRIRVSTQCLSLSSDQSEQEIGYVVLILHLVLTLPVPLSNRYIVSFCLFVSLPLISITFFPETIRSSHFFLMINPYMRFSPHISFSDVLIRLALYVLPEPDAPFL